MRTNREKIQLEEELEQLAVRYFQSESRAKALELDLWGKTYEYLIWFKGKDLLEEEYIDATDISMKALRQYDPAKSSESSKPYTSYLNSQMKWARVNRIGKKQKKQRGESSLDDLLEPKRSEDGARKKSVPDDLQVDSALDDVLKAEVPVKRLQLIALMLYHAIEQASPKSRAEKRAQYDRLFFTEGMSRTMMDLPEAIDELERHERDLWRAMNAAYLNSYMAKLCETLRDMGENPYRLYSEIVPGREAVPLDEYIQRRADRKFPLDVEMQYLREQEGDTISDSSLSERRKKYSERLHEQFDQL